MAERITVEIVAKDLASNTLGKLSGSLHRMGEVAGGILAFRTFEKIAGGIMATVNAAMEAYEWYDRIRFGLRELSRADMVEKFEGMELTTSGWAKAFAYAETQAQKLLEWTRKLAITSPFSFEDIAKTFRLTRAYGFLSDEAQNVTAKIVDYAAATGFGREALERLGLALGQVRQRGRLAGEEIRQLINVGIPVRDIVAKAFGVTTKELEAMIRKGLIPGGKALEAILGWMGRFEGASERSLDTWQGLIANLKDVKDLNLIALFDGIAKAMVPGLSKFFTWMASDTMTNRLKAWGEVLGGFVGQGMGWLDRLYRTINNVSRYFRQGFKDAWIANDELAVSLIDLWAKLQPVRDAFQDIADVVWPEISESFQDALVNLGIIWDEHGDSIIELFDAILMVTGAGVSGAIGFVGTVLESITAAIAGVDKSQVEIWGEFVDTMVNLSQIVFDKSPLIQKVSRWIEDSLTEALDPAKSAMGQFIFLVATQGWTSTWEQINAVIANDAKERWESLIKSATAGMGAALFAFFGSEVPLLGWSRTGVLWATYLANAFGLELTKRINAILQSVNLLLAAIGLPTIPGLTFTPISIPPPGGGGGGGGGKGGGTSGNCFVAGTLVHTPQGMKPIESLSPGDELFVYSDGALEPSTIAQTIRAVRGSIVDITTDATRLRCSDNHRFLTQEGLWLEARDLLPGVVLALGQTIVSVRGVPGLHNVYNFEVDHPSHTYVVQGCVVHNAKKNAYAEGGRFIIDGPPGVDKAPVFFWGTKGEMVTVTPAGEAMGQGGGGNQQNLNIYGGLHVRDKYDDQSVNRLMRRYFGGRGMV